MDEKLFSIGQRCEPAVDLIASTWVSCVAYRLAHNMPKAHMGECNVNCKLYGHCKVLVQMDAKMERRQ